MRNVSEFDRLKTGRDFSAGACRGGMRPVAVQGLLFLTVFSVTFPSGLEGRFNHSSGGRGFFGPTASHALIKSGPVDMIMMKYIYIIMTIHYRKLK